MLRGVVSGEGYKITGPAGEEYLLEREALLSGVSELTIEAPKTNDYVLRWTEAKGDYYLVQRLEDGEWLTMGPRGMYGRARVRDRHAQILPGVQLPRRRRGRGRRRGRLRLGEQRAHGDHRALAALLHRLAPHGDGLLLRARRRAERYADVPAATALCVLGEENGFFKVRYSGQYGYIDSNYCMINLPEYLGELLSYDITNSYASKYAVHGYEIPESPARWSMAMSTCSSRTGSISRLPLPLLRQALRGRERRPCQGLPPEDIRLVPAQRRDAGYIRQGRAARGPARAGARHIRRGARGAGPSSPRAKS